MTTKLNYLRPIPKNTVFDKTGDAVSKKPLPTELTCDALTTVTPIYFVKEMDKKNSVLGEINTVTLSEPLLAHNEYIITVIPQTQRPIKKIVAVYAVMDNENLNYDIKFSTQRVKRKSKSFRVSVKNDGDTDYKLTLQYHVLFAGGV